jgi:hypothetical protein
MPGPGGWETLVQSVVTILIYRVKLCFKTPGKLKVCDHINTFNGCVDKGKSQVSTYALARLETGLYTAERSMNKLFQ